MVLIKSAYNFLHFRRLPYLLSILPSTTNKKSRFSGTEPEKRRLTNHIHSSILPLKGGVEKNGVVMVIETSEVFGNLGGLVVIIGVRREA
jgi:hypothetical protein